VPSHVVAQRPELRRIRSAKGFRASERQLTTWQRRGGRGQRIHAVPCHGGLSPRAYHRVLKLAHTLADLEDRAQIAERHVMEALGYRELDRGAQEGGEAQVGA
jgi:predicted ATPase with chaperone activity